MFKIEKGINRPNAGAKVYPFDKMDINDSFYFEGKANVIRSAASMYSARKGAKFSVLKEGNGYRVWRIS